MGSNLRQTNGQRVHKRHFGTQTTLHLISFSLSSCLIFTITCPWISVSSWKARLATSAPVCIVGVQEYCQVHRKAPQYKECCYECNYHDLGHGAKITHYRWVLRSYMYIHCICLRMESETSYILHSHLSILTHIQVHAYTCVYYIAHVQYTPVLKSVKWSTVGTVHGKHSIQVLDLFHRANHTKSTRSKHFLTCAHVKQHSTEHKGNTPQTATPMYTNSGYSLQLTYVRM